MTSKQTDTSLTPHSQPLDLISELDTLAAQHGPQPIVLVCNNQAKIICARRLALCKHSFGVTVATFTDWVKDLWDLWGDGRTLVSSELRQLLLWKCITASIQPTHTDAAIDTSPKPMDSTDSLSNDNVQFPNPSAPTRGIISLAEQLARQALPIFDGVDNAQGITVCERQLITALSNYEQQLTKLGYVEQSRALALLNDRMPLSAYQPLMYQFDYTDVSIDERAFLHALNAHPVELAHKDYQVSELAQLKQLLFHRGPDNAPIKPTGALTCVFASGISAQNNAMLQAILDAVATSAACTTQSESSIIVASEDPYRWFQNLAPALTQRSIAYDIQASCSFKTTYLGRALIDITELIDGTPDVARATDTLFNPCTGTSCYSAFKSDRAHRHNRLITKDDILTDLAGLAPDDALGLISNIEEGDISTACDTFTRLICSHAHLSEAERSRELAVCARFRSLGNLAQSIDIPLNQALNLCAETSIPFSAATNITDDVHYCVHFMSVSEAAALDAQSVDTLIIADADAVVYPVTSPDDSFHTLLAKLGVSFDDDPLTRMRTRWIHVIAAAQSKIVWGRTMHDQETERLAATIFEEVLDCYRLSLTEDNDIDAASGVPQALLPWTTIVSEAPLTQNALFMPAKSQLTIELPPTGSIDAQLKDDVVIPRPYREAHPDGVNLSPSQIESYLECPYLWFTKRRLKAQGIDEDFSSLERGTFVHRVLEEYHRALTSHEIARVDATSVEIAHTVMDETFASVVKQQPFEKFGRRYAPINSVEERQQADILPHLHSFVDAEQYFAPNYRTKAVEWSYGESYPFPYAGAQICGTIDRIDVDTEHNRAIIIDYKTSLTPVYTLFEASKDDDSSNKEFHLPRKMQALVYAKVVRDLLGLDVVATLYVNPLNQLAAGAFDQRIFSNDDVLIPHRWMDQCSIPCHDIDSFDTLIDRSEEMVANRLLGLAQDRDIRPNPLDDDACLYCPVAFCSQRRVPQRTRS
jgi:hypothetical protein